MPNSVFFIYSKYHPVSITWDTALWSIHNTDCYFTGSFFHNTDIILEPGWWTGFVEIPYGCLGLLEEYTFDTTSHPWQPTVILDSISGVGQRLIHGVHLQPAQFYHPLSPCPFVVHVPYMSNTDMDPVKIYPNPGREVIHIVLPVHFLGVNTSLQAQIMDTNRINMYHCSIFNDMEFHIPVNDLHSGIYYLVFVDSKGHWIQTERFVIIQ